jgi:ribosomal-protein-alanine N-acetyltransferase
MRIELHDGFYLSPVVEGDEAAYLEHFRDKETTDRLVAIAYPYTPADAEKWVRFCHESMVRHGRPNQFALRRADGFLIGGAGLQLRGGLASHRAELGYWLAKDYRNRGLATAAARASVHYAFRDLGLRRIEATSSVGNPVSHRVLEKTGFTREGLLAAYYLKDGTLIDVYLYSNIARAASSPA